MNIDLTKILIAIIDLLAAIITYKLIPLIKAKTTEKQRALLEAAVQTAVFAAEQLYGAGEGQKKLDYAVAWLHDRGYDVSRAEIEACVYNYMNGVNETGNGGECA